MSNPRARLESKYDYQFKIVVDAINGLTKESQKPKRRISAEGMKRIIAATKKRWRLQRAAEKAAKTIAPVKKAVAKKSAVKKAAATPTPELAQAAGA